MFPEGGLVKMLRAIAPTKAWWGCRERKGEKPREEKETKEKERGGKGEGEKHGEKEGGSRTK